MRERWHFSEGFALLKRINPKLRTVSVLSDDSESSQYVLANMHEEARAGKFALKVLRVERLHTLQQWREAVLREQSRADALALGTYYTLVDERSGMKFDSAPTFLEMDISLSFSTTIILRPMSPA